MSTFPTLTYPPEATDRTEEVALNPALRTTTEGGYVFTRAKFTNVKRVWHEHYPIVTNADKLLIATFEQVTVLCGALAFNWYDYQTRTTIEVRFVDKVKYKRVEGPNNYWDVEFDVEET